MALPSSQDMIAELIATPSISSFDPRLDTSNRPVCERLATYLESAGARVELQDVSGHAGKVNLLARFGAGPPGLALCGHTDTVPFDDARWQHDPFGAQLVEEKLYGLGSSDMKGFLAICASVLAQQNVAKLQRQVIVLGSADEETGMFGARALLAQGTPLAPFCVVGEPTSLVPMRQHKGIFMEKIILQGRSGHSSDPTLGNNAIDAMHEVLGALKGWRGEMGERYANPDFAVPTPTLNFGRIEGGDNPNRICARAELHIDVRLMPGMTVARSRAALRERVRRVAQASGVEVEFDVLFEGIDPLTTAADAAVVKHCEALSGHRAGCVNFGTEAPFFNELGSESVVFGPGDIDLAHQPDEYLDLRQIKPTADALSALIEHFCRDTHSAEAR
ncbi:MAG: acetylornithine deacetylase [Gammaproteobacteria bacterium]